MHIIFFTFLFYHYIFLSLNLRPRCCSLLFLILIAFYPLFSFTAFLSTLDDISLTVSFFHFCNYNTIFLLYFDAFLSFTCISYFDLPLLHLGTSISTLFFPRSSKFFSPCCIIRLLENIKNILDENIFNSKHFTSLRLTTTNGCLFPRAT